LPIGILSDGLNRFFIRKIHLLLENQSTKVNTLPKTSSAEKEVSDKSLTQNWK
jgi:hypothetical protein